MTATPWAELEATLVHSRSRYDRRSVLCRPNGRYMGVTGCRATDGPSKTFLFFTPAPIGIGFRLPKTHLIKPMQAAGGNARRRSQRADKPGGQADVAYAAGDPAGG